MLSSYIALSLLAYQAATQELSSTLHSTIYGAQIAFVDEMVVFTCVVRGSNSMSWTSDEYIGSDRRLPLSSGQLVNHSISAIGNAQTVAVLVDVTAGEVIKSELHIRVQSSYPLASVQCVDGSTNMNTSTSFLLVGKLNVGCITVYPGWKVSRISSAVREYSWEIRIRAPNHAEITRNTRRCSYM